MPDIVMSSIISWMVLGCFNPAHGIYSQIPTIFFIGVEPPFLLCQKPLKLVQTPIDIQQHQGINCSYAINANS